MSLAAAFEACSPASAPPVEVLTFGLAEPSLISLH